MSTIFKIGLFFCTIGPEGRNEFLHVIVFGYNYHYYYLFMVSKHIWVKYN